MSFIQREIEDVERFEEILHTLVSEETGYVLDKLDLEDRLPVVKRLSAKRQTKPGPERLRETIEELGTTFIKFGQIMAERPDIVPERYAEELQKLQDSAPPFDSEKAKQIVDREVGLDHFSSFEKEPLAAASIAQVHRAELDGKDVVVKIRRPGVKEEVKKDLDILKFLAKRAEKHFERFEAIKAVELVREFSRWTKNELDLEKECRNAQIFKENLEDEEKLYVPEVYPELTTEKVLVMEYVEGIKATEAEKINELEVDREELAETAIKAGMRQVVIDGFFHADPHPSNFLIQEDGSFVYMDFGMMGEIPRDMREKIDLLLLHAINEDSGKVLEILKEIGHTSENANLERIKQDIDRKVLLLRNSSISEASISKELLDMIVTSGRNGLHLPMNMTLMGKNLITMEGIGMKICPDYQPGDAYEKYGKQLLVESNQPDQLAQDLLLDLVENKEMLTRPASKLREKLDEDKKTVIQNNSRSKTLPSALIVSSAILIAASVIDQRLLYLGAAQLLLGVYLYR